ncbi:MAG: endopeptidase La, partial [Deltaproteobacteria bacterium]|nr:endopeptidase La [Deltaproteobacteria bacterium]
MKNTDTLTSARTLPETLSLKLNPDVRGEVLPETMKFVPSDNANAYPFLETKILVPGRFLASLVRPDKTYETHLAFFLPKKDKAPGDEHYPSDLRQSGVAARLTKVETTERGGILRLSLSGLARVGFSELGAGELPEMRVAPKKERRPENAKTLIKLLGDLKRLFLGPGEKNGKFESDFRLLETLVEKRPSLPPDYVMATLDVTGRVRGEYAILSDVAERYLRVMELLLKGVPFANVTDDDAPAAPRAPETPERLPAIETAGKTTGETADKTSGKPTTDPARDLPAEADGLSALFPEIREKLASPKLPERVRKVAERETERLRHSAPFGSERGVILDYLEWLAELPWEGDDDFETPDLAKARQILDRDHWGLEKVKKRILEFLAVLKLTRGAAKTPILCLAGPPGVGKTSLGKSVAACLGREFASVSLGGIGDEAEIRGHRRAYVGARPGRIIAALRRAGANNPVFLLDEIDKLSRGPAGDPGSALLEALDPEQNRDFTDHFLEMPFDLSKVLFVITANVPENIPDPLKNRLEIIRIPGYSQEEKLQIARRHVLPGELKRHGLEPDDLILSDDTLATVIDRHTREAGVRELSRAISALAGSRSLAKAEGRKFEKELKTKDLPGILGSPFRRPGLPEKQDLEGVVAGLAWTPEGGEIMLVEAAVMPGCGRISLTGHLGNVMIESARTAISLVRSRAKDWNLDDSFFLDRDFHVHLPQGAIPKDGPSAGVCLATVIVSLAANRKIRSDLAMTGEITLRGPILPVGGLKDKLLAAKRAGMNSVIVPERNLEDISEFRKDLPPDLEIIPVHTMDDVL